MMRIEKLTKAGLKDFIESGRFETYDFLPISRHRALSQIENPLALEDDVLLYLAMDGEKLAGYLGCLPDELISENNSIHYAWLSTIYVSTDFRGKKVAQKLMSEAFIDYQNHIAMTEFTPEAENLYNKTKAFDYIPAKVGWRYYFRFDLTTLLPARKPVFGKAKMGLKVVDKIGNTFVDVKNKIWKTSASTFVFEEVLSSEIVEFIRQEAGEKMVQRIQWIVNYPWMLQGKSDSRYLFSDFTQSFGYSFINIYNEVNQLKALLMVSVRNGHMKMLYRFGETPNKHDWAEAVRWFAVKNKIKMLTCYSDVLNLDLIIGDVKPILKRPMERRYLFHKDLLKLLPQPVDNNFYDGDGDVSFT